MNFKSLVKKRSFLTVAIIFLLAIAVLLTSIKLPVAFADEHDEGKNWSETLSITNNQFANSDSGTPASPSSWTGLSANNNIVAGVLDLGSYSSNAKTYKLDEYSEYKVDAPDSPFGKVTDPSKPGYYENTNRKVMLINSVSSYGVYGYSSESFSLDANSFYTISLWAKTTDGFKGNMGAAMFLSDADSSASSSDSENETSSNTGLFSKNNIGIYDINTAQYANSVTNGEYVDGWVKYTLYIATHAYKTSTVKLNLQLGSTVNGNAKGYVMFDNIVGTKLSTESFESAALALGGNTTADRKAFFNLNESAEFPGGFFAKPASDWKVTSNTDTTNTRINFSYDATNEIVENDSYGLTESPYAPYYSSNGGNNNILLMTTAKYDALNDKFNYVKTNAAVKSNDMLIDRYSYYRVSFFAKTDSIDGSGAYATVNYINNESYEANKHLPDNKKIEYTASESITISGHSHNYVNFCWSEYAFYIKGSSFEDYYFNLEFGMGTPDDKVGGVAMFDHVTIEQLLPADYNSYSSSGTAITLDAYSDQSGITNGEFNNIASYENLNDYKYIATAPIAPADWTLAYANNVTTTGFSKNSVNTDDIVSGIVPAESVPAISGKNGGVLKMYSPNNTAFCYQSSSIALTADTSYALTVSLQTSAISGYGANLVLKNGDALIGSIQKINTSGNYTFYIKNGSSDSSVTVELWLGLNDRINNTYRLAKGTVYYTGVNLATVEDGSFVYNNVSGLTFDDINEKYNTQRSISTDDLAFASVDMSKSIFTAYDTYDTSDLKTPFNWSLKTTDSNNTKYGIFDSTGYSGTTVHPEFKSDDNRYIMMMYNIGKAYSQLTLDVPYTLSESSYYKLDVKIKTRFAKDYLTKNADAIGAGIKLSEGNFAFKDIQDTALVKGDPNTPQGDVEYSRDTEHFDTYTFYISTSDVNSSLSLTFTLGGENKKEYIEGRLYISSITLTDISNTDYDKAAALIKEEKDDNEFDGKRLMADFTTESTDEDNEDDTETDDVKNPIQWWLIPSVLFAAALIIAVVGIFIRRKIESRPVRTKVSKTVSYDRANIKTEPDYSNLTKEEIENLPVITEDTFESFDDEVKPVETEKAAPKKKPITEEVDTPAPIVAPAPIKKAKPIDNFDTFDDEPIARKAAPAEVATTEETQPEVTEAPAVEETPSETAPEEVATTEAPESTSAEETQPEVIETPTVEETPSETAPEEVATTEAPESTSAEETQPEVTETPAVEETPSETTDEGEKTE